MFTMNFLIWQDTPPPPPPPTDSQIQSRQGNMVDEQNFDSLPANLSQPSPMLNRRQFTSDSNLVAVTGPTSQSEGTFMQKFVSKSWSPQQM